jgi:hypothetical protein
MFLTVENGVRWHVQEQDASGENAQTHGQLKRHQIIEKPDVAVSVDVELEKTHRICSSAPVDASPGLLDWARGGAATRQPNSAHESPSREKSDAYGQSCCVLV